jgi:hypothetical protein
MLFSVIRIYKSKAPLINLYVYTHTQEPGQRSDYARGWTSEESWFILDRDSVHTGSSTHSGYYLTGMGWGALFTQGRRVKLTTRLHLVPRLRSGVTVPPPSSPYAFMAFTGTPLHSRIDLYVHLITHYACTELL